MARYCDIVMKGGVTSGVVYPLAAVELSHEYQFRNVGGTSAGAIAAAAVAAAEHGRQHGNEGAFHRLAELPGWLGQNLTSLFQPGKSTKPLFGIVMAATGAKEGMVAKLSAIIRAAIRNFPIAALLAAAPGVALAVAAAALDGDLFLRILCFLCGLLMVAVLVPVVLGLTVGYRLITAVPQNSFGLCTGGGPGKDGAPPLTSWLAELLDDLAGKPTNEPLTFQDLWNERNPGDERDVNLEMMTTCLTQGRPYRLPFDHNRYWFRPEDLYELFPGYVVDWMIDHPGVSEEGQEFEGLRKLPDAADLPVVVATRMSLSFPLLFSAVPLYAIDYSRPGLDDDDEPAGADEREPERCWFSDGGITSNFPVHFFDAPIPRWPTFAINLRPFHRYREQDLEDECRNVWMPPTNRSGIAEWWTPWGESPPPAGLGKKFKVFAAFCKSILDTVQNWRDNAQLSVPGYRDRVVHISHSDREGGMNLAMPPEVIERLSRRGECAGAELRRRFAVPPPEKTRLTWENQRWVRYRSFMALLQRTGEQLVSAHDHPVPPDGSIEELIRNRTWKSKASYPWRSDDQLEFALRETRELIELLRDWGEPPDSFTDGAPKPRPDLRVVPRI